MRLKLGEKISGLFVCAFELVPQNAHFALKSRANKGKLDVISVSEYSYSTPTYALKTQRFFRKI